MTVSLKDVPRDEQLRVAKKVRDRLMARRDRGPDEPGLDGFIAELDEVIALLEGHATGKTTTDAVLAGLLSRVEMADVDVDTWLRHIDSFLWVEATRRAGPNVVAAAKLAQKASPLGLKLVDAPIVEENSYCREMMTVLKAPESQATLTAIAFPTTWLDTMDAALGASDGAYAALVAAKAARTGYVAGAQGAELEWCDTMVRLRRYIGSRARRNDATRKREGQELLTELLDALAKLRAAAAARATRREKDEAAPAAPTTEPVVS